MARRQQKGAHRRPAMIVVGAGAAMLACVAPEAQDETPLDTMSVSADTAAATPLDTMSVSADTAAATPSLEAAIRDMLQGPGDSARAAATHSWFSDTTSGALRSVTVTDGRAIVDFADLRSLIPNASTSAGSELLLRELNTTVFAVPGIDSVEYRIEGSCEAFWEWLQYGGCQVQHGLGTR